MSEQLFEQWLLDRGVLSPEQARHAHEIQENTHPAPTFGSTVAGLGYVTQEQVTASLAEMIGATIVDLEKTPPDPELQSLIPPTVAQAMRVIPVVRENGHILMATCLPLGAADQTKLSFLAGQPVRLAAASEPAILECMRLSQGVTVESLIANLSRNEGGESAEGEVFVHDLREMAQEPTLVNLVNAIISKAIEERTSDIHIEPFENELKIKYRIDGILQEMPPPPKQFQSAIVSRIKIMAGMDIAERYIPQDGQIRVNLPKSKVDIRVSTVPTVFGESVVMRLLNKDESLLDLKSLGMNPRIHAEIGELLKRPYGILLVCGPTGSGKTTTLYSALKQIFTIEKKIITIEDPVEYQMPGVNQIPVRPKRGLTFATGLRAILRQDPDIIMVGEIRDRETADIAIRAALTGHFVLSTLHTNDAPGAITRLIDMGIEPFLIASSVQGLQAQRLVRRLCPHCRKLTPLAHTAGAQIEKKFGLPHEVYEPAGCDECRNRGYQGRVGIHELLKMTDKLHDLILSSASSGEIKAAAGKQMISMRQDGFDKVAQGLTSVAEVLQATQFEDQSGG